MLGHERFTSADEPGARVLRIKLASITPPGTLELWLPAEGGYPLAPALPSFVCASLAPAALAALTPPCDSAFGSAPLRSNI